jgi:hypothetical protein
LKKYKRPIQVIPATKWTQRISIREVAADSGGVMLGVVKTASRPGISMDFLL